MKRLVVFYLILLICIQGTIAQHSNCGCYEVLSVEINATDTLGLTLLNTCDNNVYLNLYVISSISPFDTLAKQDFWGGVFPLNEPTTQYLATKLTHVPDFGSYRVSITNGTLVCDSLKFSSVFTPLNHGFDTNVSIHPNPAKDYIQLEYQLSGELQATLYNSLGDLVFRKPLSDHQRIDLSGFSNGLYVLVLSDGHTKIRKRIVNY